MAVYSDFNQADPGFYNYVHSVIETLDKEKESPERRRIKRHPMSVYHRIAIYNDGIPEPSAFSSVLCYDLSTSGFSFFMPMVPTFELLVVAFDLPDQVIYLKTKVIHSKNVLLHPSGVVEQVGERTSHSNAYTTEAPTPMLLIGCKFLERLEESPSLPPPAEQLEEAPSE